MRRWLVLVLVEQSSLHLAALQTMGYLEGKGKRPPLHGAVVLGCGEGGGDWVIGLLPW